MKTLFLIIFLLFSSNSFSQLKKYEKEVDSLSILYKKKVIGFSRTITLNIEPRETFLIFYVENGETEEFIAWEKVIDSNEKILILGSLDFDREIPFIFTNLIYYNNSVIGDMTNGYFTKIKKTEYDKFAVNRDAQLFLSNNDELDKWLRIRFGGYYKGLKIN